MSSQPQSLVLWLCLFSWHLIITLLILILPWRSSTTWWYLVVDGILRDSKTAGENISGKKEKIARTKQKIKAVLNSRSVFRWIFKFFNLPTCSVLCKAESFMAAKRYYCPFRKCSFLDEFQGCVQWKHGRGAPSERIIEEVSTEAKCLLKILSTIHSAAWITNFQYPFAMFSGLALSFFLSLPTQSYIC